MMDVRTWALRVGKWTAFLFVLELMVLGWLVGFVAHLEDTLAPPNETDAIIVLGAQVKAWGAPSDTLLLRMQLALAQYEQNPRPIICCGGQGEHEPVPEGDFIRDWMLRQGVPAEHAISENTSRNTRENIANAQAILQSQGLRTALIVSSDYHVARALAICEQAGLVATGVGSQSHPRLWWKNHVRESLSWIKFWLGL